MKPIALIIGLHFALCGLWAQGTPSKISIVADYPNVSFSVDGVAYRGSASFFWQEGSQHTLGFPGSDEGYQYSLGQSIRYVFLGWEDPSGTMQLGTERNQVITALAAVTTIRLSVDIEYQVLLRFWRDNTVRGPQDPQPVCGVPGLAGPQEYRPGVVFVNETCYWSDAAIYMKPGTYPLAAYPYPGFAFLGWGVDTGSPNSFLSTIHVQGPMTLVAYFRPGKRVKFITEPLGLQVLIDRVPTRTPTALPCNEMATIPLGVPPGVQPLCLGEVDWPPGTKHIIGAPSPQRDGRGREWVFDSFSNGMGNNAVYEVDSKPSPEILTARFVRSARATFLTVPSGLKLNINGRDNWLSSTFVTAPGRKFTVAAPMEQVDSHGRHYVFHSWSNGGDATQEVTVPADAIDNGFVLTATYDLLSQVVIESRPSGVPVEVEGATCTTPCSINKPDGTKVQVAAPVRQTVSDTQRWDFVSWSDGGARERTITVAGKDTVHVTANYNTLYLLLTASNPAGGADFTMAPPSPDGFYVKDTDVSITAKARDGFRFRRWSSDLEGTYHTGWLRMSVPRSVIAEMDKVPFIPPAGIANAAGETPDDVVAPGSIISIYGGMLAPFLQIGPQSPLLQTLAGVTVRADDRILALLFVSPTQINAILYPDLEEGPHRLIVSRAGQEDVKGDFTVARNAPGIFTRIFDEKPFVMAAHEDGTAITPTSPARKDELISIYGTGFGPYDKVAPYGFPLPEAPDYRLVDPIQVFAGDLPVTPEFAGGAPKFSGTDLLKIRITDKLPAHSTVEFKVRINEHESNTALLPIE